MPPDGRHVFLKGKVQMITYLPSTSHDPTGNYFQGDVKADSAGTIVWL